MKNNRLYLVIVVLICAINLFANPKKENYYIDNQVLDFPKLNYSNSQVFQLISHGRPGELLIDGQWKNAKEIAIWLSAYGFHHSTGIVNHKSSIVNRNSSIIQHSASNIKHLNIYGCEFAKGEKGLAAVAYLENILGVTVAASNNLTGIDGDWKLEVGQPVAALAIPKYKSNLQGTYPNCTYGSYNKYQYVTRDNVNSNLGQTNANYFGAIGPPDIVDAASDVASNRLYFWDAQYGAFLYYNNPILKGDTLTFYISALSASAPAFTITLYDPVANTTSVIGNANAITSEPSSGPFTPVKVVVPSTFSGTTYTALMLQGASGYFYLDAVKVSNMACNTCAAGNIKPILSNYGGICSPATSLTLSSITASNTPSGSSLTWHTGTPATAANQISSSTVVSSGTYYAAFENTTSSCYGGINGDGTATTTIVVGNSSSCNGTADIANCTTANQITNGSFTNQLNGWTYGTWVWTPSYWSGTYPSAYCNTDGASSVPLWQLFNGSQAAVTNGTVHLSFDAYTNNYNNGGVGTTTTAYVNVKINGVIYAVLNNQATMTATATASNGATITPATMPVSTTQPTTLSGFTHFDMTIPASALTSTSKLAFEMTASSLGDDWAITNINIDGPTTCVCNAGTTAMTLSATTATNACPNTTANISTLVSSTCPTNSTLEWHTASTPTSANLYTTPTQATAGTYYPVCHDVTNNCYSPSPATGVTVTLTPCSISLTNTCPTNTVNLNTALSITSTTPVGTTLTWHTAIPVSAANTVSNPAAVGAGTYYASYFDSISNCYGPVSSTVITVTTVACCDAGTSAPVLIKN